MIAVAGDCFWKKQDEEISRCKNRDTQGIDRLKHVARVHAAFHAYLGRYRTVQMFPPSSSATLHAYDAITRLRRTAEIVYRG